VNGKNREQTRWQDVNLKADVIPEARDDLIALLDG
jgi:hypothetical protein